MQYWSIRGRSIIWRLNERLPPHNDSVEMSGYRISVIVRYGADESGRLVLSQHCVWPMLRTIPNDTHASHQMDMDDGMPHFRADGVDIHEYPEWFRLEGILSMRCRTDIPGLELERSIWPDAEGPYCCERITWENNAAQAIQIDTDSPPLKAVSYMRGARGVYVAEARITGRFHRIEPGCKAESFAIYSACVANRPIILPDPLLSLRSRAARLCCICGGVRLDTGIDEVDAMFRFAQIRAGESVFETLSGKLHSPGGGAYYAAIWCNDEIEYAGPWFAYAGDQAALEASLNAYRKYMPFMSDAWLPIPSSIIAEGMDIWDKDRGDEAMYAYGASLFMLFLGDSSITTELLPAVRWCLEYCLRHLNEDGVVGSKTDELEGRFPSGDANLNTSCLAYGGFMQTAMLLRSLGMEDEARTREAQANELRASILRYFTKDGAYQYYAGCSALRAWNCMPLCMGINEYAEETLKALFSEPMWMDASMRTEQADETVWDRSALYAFRAALQAGHWDLCGKRFIQYCESRLLGEHVPYAIESNAEGNSKRQLSAESALFCRAVTEGLLGLAPLGLRSFSFNASLPNGLPHLRLYGLKAFGASLDFEIEPDGWGVFADGVRIASGNPISKQTVML